MLYSNWLSGMVPKNRHEKLNQCSTCKKVFYKNNIFENH